MQRAILIVLSFGLIASTVSAQPADEPSTVRGAYGDMGGYGGYGGSPYGGEYGRRRIDPRVTQRLIERWKTSNDAAEREKIETELRGRLQQEFAARLAAHEKEIKQLEEKVRQLRERLTLRKEKQDEIVDHRLQQILREAQGLGWGSAGAASGSDFQVYRTTTSTQPATDDLFGAADTSATEPAAADDIFGDAVSEDATPAPSRR